MSVRVRRSAFTLVELIVVMSIVVVLATLTLAVVVNMGERDGTTDAAGLTRQWLMIAKNRAARDHSPRGLRLVVPATVDLSANPAKTNNQWVTELQYIEQPSTLVPTNPYPPGSPQAPCVKIGYWFDASGNVQKGPPDPSECWIENLLPADQFLIENFCIPGGLIVLYDLRNSADTGPYSGRMMSVIPPAVTDPPSPPGTTRVKVRLDSFPDVALGAAGQSAAGRQFVFTSYSFGITPPPQEIVGEPPLQLPKGICIDLTASAVSSSGASIDILFTPSGHVVPMGGGWGRDGMIHLWHRDYTKIQIATSPLTWTDAEYAQAGEQQLVTIRCKTGGLGQFPVMWPSSGPDPYFFARSGVTQP